MELYFAINVSNMSLLIYSKISGLRNNNIQNVNPHLDECYNLNVTKLTYFLV